MSTDGSEIDSRSDLLPCSIFSLPTCNKSSISSAVNGNNEGSEQYMVAFTCNVFVISSILLNFSVKIFRIFNSFDAKLSSRSSLEDGTSCNESHCLVNGVSISATPSEEFSLIHSLGYNSKLLEPLLG